MNDASEILKRQHAWQKSLRNLPWPEKVRLIARVRQQLEELRRQAPGPGKGRERA